MSARANSSALSSCEAEILSLWDDECLSIEAIAERTGYAETYVKTVVSRYNVSGTALNAFDKMSKLGSIALLDAIRRHHPEMVASTPLRAGSGGAR